MINDKLLHLLCEGKKPHRLFSVGGENTKFAEQTVNTCGSTWQNKKCDFIRLSRLNLTFFNAKKGKKSQKGGWASNRMLRKNVQKNFSSDLKNY